MNAQITSHSVQRQSFENPDGKQLRDCLDRKLDNLSPEQLNSVSQFVEFLEYQQTHTKIENPMTNEEIDQIVASYRQQNKSLPIGLAKGEFVVPDDFDDPLPDDILDLFEGK